MSETSEPFTAWITKYALSSGIFSDEFAVCLNVSDSMIVRVSKKYEYYHGEGKDWHRTAEGAIARAEEMRSKKIATLEQQIKKLQKLSFSKGVLAP